MNMNWRQEWHRNLVKHLSGTSQRGAYWKWLKRLPANWEWYPLLPEDPWREDAALYRWLKRLCVGIAQPAVVPALDCAPLTILV
jgi:hypothetical protein